ncbi:hypothetical protein N665_0288s0003 [Sinapis alba]|nr:hypothetical protein N665_0288s0003 [Sinapis alba]
MGSRTFLSDLSLFKPLLPVRVKVIYKGRTEFGSRFHKSQLIFGDAKRNTIHATFYKNLDDSTETLLGEGHCYEIKNFSITPATELTRLTKNRCHIKLNASSVISQIEPISISNYYCFANFLNIYRGLSHPKFSVDIYGAVVGVGFLEEYMTEASDGEDGFIDLRIRFSIVNMEYCHIKCIAYGAIAQEFNELWNSTDANVVLCVL